MTEAAEKAKEDVREAQSIFGQDAKDVGPIKPAADDFDPAELKFCKDFEDGDWKCYYDFLPDKDEPLMYDRGKRAPLTFKQLKEFIPRPELDIPGLKRTDRVVCACITGCEYAVCFLAYSIRCGWAPVNVQMKPEEFEFEFEDLPAKGLIVLNKDNLEGREEVKATGIAVAAARKKKVTMILQLTPDPDTVGLFTIGQHSAGKKLEGEKLENPLASVSRDDIAVVFHTSGTTKKPKIVPVHHGFVAVGSKCHSNCYLMKEEDVFVNYFPMFHMAALIENFLAAAFAGARFVAIRGNYQAHVFYKAILEEPYPTAYSAVPTHNSTLIQYATEMSKETGKPFKNHIRVIRNDSAALLPSLALQMEEFIDAKVIPAYSMTECCPITCNPLNGTRKLKSVGPTCGPDMKLLEGWPSSTEVTVGNEGEVSVRGSCCMKGYEMRDHMDQDPNTEAWTDGFMRTGDQGWMDAEGYLYLTGRFKELINRAGEKVSPFVIEDAVRRYDAVKDVLCFSAPHELLGEVPAIVCTVEPGKTLKLSELRDWLMGRGILQAIWCPEVLITMPEIPMGTNAGKPARINLAKRLELEKLSGELKQFEHPGLARPGVNA